MLTPGMQALPPGLPFPRIVLLIPIPRSRHVIGPTTRVEWGIDNKRMIVYYISKEVVA